jgi:hypothetical protein
MAPTTPAELNELHREHYKDAYGLTPIPLARGFSPQDLRKAEIVSGEMPGVYRELGLETLPETVSSRELVTRNRDYWRPNTLPIARDRAPITLAELNEKNRQFWARRSR